MPERLDPVEFLKPHIASADGLPVRPAGPWARDKLGILAMYLPRFALASQRAPARYFVDGLAGPGLCEMDDTGELLEGSTLIALRVPELTKCVSMELDENSAAALSARTARFGDRAIVERGDVNVDLLTVMERVILRRSAPMLVFLDPEGFEIDWATITKLSRFRDGARKAELLMLAMTSMIPRVVAARDQRQVPGRLAWALPPGPGWLEIAERLEAREISPEAARAEWAKLYERQLTQELGYAYARVRAITRKGDPTDASIYHLVFATDHEAGDRIMGHAFDRMWVNQSPTPPPSAQLAFDLDD